jgi:hypothetical protein
MGNECTRVIKEVAMSSHMHKKNEWKEARLEMGYVT